MTQKTYDGFFFSPGDEENELQLSFFEFKDEMLGGEPVGGTAVGSLYHIAFFRPQEDGTFQFDETFEAIFADPETYITNLAGTNLFGCVLKKTTKSDAWFQEYLKKAKEKVKIFNMSLKEA